MLTTIVIILVVVVMVALTIYYNVKSTVMNYEYIGTFPRGQFQGTSRGNLEKPEDIINTLKAFPSQYFAILYQDGIYNVRTFKESPAVNLSSRNEDKKTIKNVLGLGNIYLPEQGFGSLYKTKGSPPPLPSDISITPFTPIMIGTYKPKPNTAPFTDSLNTSRMSEALDELANQNVKYIGIMKGGSIISISPYTGVGDLSDLEKAEGNVVVSREYTYSTAPGVFAIYQIKP